MRCLPESIYRAPKRSTLESLGPPKWSIVDVTHITSYYHQVHIFILDVKSLTAVIFRILSLLNRSAHSAGTKVELEGMVASFGRAVGKCLCYCREHVSDQRPSEYVGWSTICSSIAPLKASIHPCGALAKCAHRRHLWLQQGDWWH